MKQPIFEHSTERANAARIKLHTTSTEILSLLLAEAAGMIATSPISKGAAVARVAFAYARELERREIAIAEASRQPKWIEGRFDRIQRGLATEDYPGQMS